MERQGDARRPLPRRGQVKASIFASLFACLIPKAAEGERKEGKLRKAATATGGVVPGGWEEKNQELRIAPIPSRKLLRKVRLVLESEADLLENVLLVDGFRGARVE